MRKPCLMQSSVRICHHISLPQMSTALTLAKLPLLMLGGQDSLHFFLRRSQANKTNPWRKIKSYIRKRTWQCVWTACQKNPSFQPAAVSMCFHNVHPCGPSELKFLQATSYCPSQGSSTCVASYVSSLAFAPAPERANQNSGPEAKAGRYRFAKHYRNCFVQFTLKIAKHGTT